MITVGGQNKPFYQRSGCTSVGIAQSARQEGAKGVCFRVKPPCIADERGVIVFGGLPGESACVAFADLPKGDVCVRANGCQCSMHTA